MLTSIFAIADIAVYATVGSLVTHKIYETVSYRRAMNELMNREAELEAQAEALFGTTEPEVEKIPMGFAIGSAAMKKEETEV